MIVPMKRLTLVARKDEEQRIMEALQAISAIEVIETGEQQAGEDLGLAAAESKVQKLSNALLLLKPYGPKKSLLAEKPTSTVEALGAGVEDALAVAEELERMDRAKSSTRAQAEKCSVQIEELSPWSALDTPMNKVRATYSTALYQGFVPEEMLGRLSELPDECAIEELGGVGKRAILIACPKAAAQEAYTLLRELDFSEYAFPTMAGTAAEAIESLKQQIEALKAEEAKLEADMAALGDKKPDIAAAQDAAVIERDRLAAMSALSGTETAFHLEGWARSDRIDAITSAIESITDAYYLDARDPAEDEIPPSVVENKQAVRPYEAVTNLYSRPDPGAIDGTPLMMPFYFVFFGMMLGDLGYGLLLLIGCLIFLKKAKPTGMIGELARVIRDGAISTIIWAPLIGTMFGEDLDLIFGTPDLFPLLVDPMADPMMMLVLCLGMGAIQIIYGMIIKIKMSLAVGDWQTAVFDNGCWLLVFLGIGLFMIPAIKVVGIVLIAVGVLGILFMKGRAKKNPVSRIVSGLGELYQITSYLSDVLSYARLFALGIATGVIGSVYNMLGTMLMSSENIVLQIVGTIIGIALLCFLHVFNLAINTLGTFVHCARLQYIEFYGKFYEAGGKPFRPLGYNTRHVRVTR